MAGMPSFNQILDARAGRQQALKATRVIDPYDPIAVYNRSLGRKTAFQMVDPSEWVAQKSVTFNRYQMDFINDTGGGIQPYMERQLETAFFTSVYLFAAIRRVANLISRARIVAEIKQAENKWERADPNILINRIFDAEGSHIQSRMYLNWAVYGMAAAYKIKTRKAIIEEARKQPIYDYKDGAVAGLHVLDKPFFEPEDDIASADVKGLFVQQESEYTEGRSRLTRKEFVYFTDWNPRHYHRARSLVGVAIHEAVTNSSIARWASEYFTRGALPMLIVSLANDDPNEMAPTDLMALKHKFEQGQQGVGESLRASFMDRPVKVEQVGIRADEVAAPELNKAALEGISAAVGIERDLIVAPEGGTQERHEQMIMQVWTDTVIPWLKETFISALNKDLGLPDNMRLGLDVSHISELEARRNEKADTEVKVYQAGLETINEARKRLDMPPIEGIGDWIWNGVDQIPMSFNRLKSQDALVNDKLFTQIIGAWDGFLITRSEALSMMGKKLPEGAKDGYKFEVTPQEQQQAFAAMRSWLEEQQGKHLTQQVLDTVSSEPIMVSHEWQIGDGVPTVTTGNVVASDFPPKIVTTDSPPQVSSNGVVTTPAVEVPIITPSQLIVGGESYTCLWLSNDPVLMDMQNQLRAVAPLLFFEDPAHLHITLTYAPFVEDTQLDKVMALLPSEVQGFELWAGPIEVWKLESDSVVVLRVTNDTALAALQSKVASAYRAFGIELSEYSAPESYKPHVTLARLPLGQHIVPPNVRAILRPQAVCIQKANYEDVKRLTWNAPPPPPPPDPLPLARGDIELMLSQVETQRRLSNMLIHRWQQTGKPPEALASRIVTCVRECISVPGVFDAAKQAVDMGWLDADSSTEENPIKWYLREKAVQDTPVEELAAWEKVALRNVNKGKRFEVKSLPVSVEHEVRGALSTFTNKDRVKIMGVFDRARRAIDDNPPGTVSETELEEWVDEIQQLGDTELLKLIAEEKPNGEETTQDSD